jgi:putative transposase
MPRPPRIHVPEAFYHVTLRGNHQQPIFSTNADRALLSEIVVRHITTYAARVHAYCWMGNHIHLLLQAGPEPIAHPMRNIAAEYARKLQKRVATTGHFFERRYHATLVDTDAYLLGVLRYIHRNPVEAGLAADIARYPWSSHHAYANGSGAWVTTDFLLSMFARDVDDARCSYRKFVDSPSDEPWIATMASNGGGELVVGSELFRARVLKQAHPRARQSLDELITEACRRFDVDEARLLSPVHDAYLAKVRGWIGFQAGKRGIASLSAVARALHRNEATLRYAMRRYPADME